MIVEVNDAGEIVVPAELVEAVPHTCLQAEREGNSVVLRRLAERRARKDQRIADLLPTLEGRPDPTMTFRREDINGPDRR